MGKCYEHQCMRCGYSALVRGGRTSGWDSSTWTIACKECGTLQDVVFGRKYCKKCRSEDIVEWKTEDACPRCGGKVIIKPGGKIMYWD
jgi:DNA-directed RNA polymerase subunit RPC12/RpoP